MGRSDLHIHTTASDGYYTPTQVVQMAAEAGLQVIAITDHDSTDGVPEALEAARRWPVQVIPGVEINADFARTELHILGYYVDWQCEPFQRALWQLRQSRLSRAQQMVLRLNKLGLPLDWQRVAEIAGEGASIGRPHIAQAMIERGYVRSIEEAFLHYIGRNSGAYVERFKLEPAAAIELVRQAQGIPVLAHPLRLMDVVPELIPSGLAGLEAYYAGYTPFEVGLLVDLAAKYRLLVTGGSDMHGGGTLPENQLGSVSIPPDVPDQLKSYQQKRASPI